MTQHVVYWVGWLTLAPVAVVAIGDLIRVVAPQWRRIWAVANGESSALVVETSSISAGRLLETRDAS